MNRVQFDREKYIITENMSKDYHDFMVKNLLEKYVASLEQRNAELEQRVKELEESKTCEGCAYINESSFIDICDNCIRLTKNKDYYEPK